VTAADTPEAYLLADAMAIVLGLAECDPTAYDAGPDYVGLMRCVLCDAAPPGGARTMLEGQHEGTCPWRQARQFAAGLTGWNRPPLPDPKTGDTTP
jgi:hypothetical protein